MASGNGGAGQTQQRNTRVLKVEASKIGHFVFDDPQLCFLGNWRLQLSEDSPDAANMLEAASQLRGSDLPVAFPTETVYGLGADATRSSAVRGIYNAKQRPSDNPLIVHVSSLSQLRKLLMPSSRTASSGDPPQDPVPHIYHSLISRFWPGPLTILLPLPTPSSLAPEVTTSLPTVAVRMPSSPLALALIQLAGVPLAAPSANASSKPSPTTAAHVLHDLSGRIDLILDGGSCTVGVESTVVDGLIDPPVILRPGGVSIDMLRDCPGWRDVKIAYKDGAETGVPRAPGMKYKHYSPNAKVLLFHGRLDAALVKEYGNGGSVGVLRTKTWELGFLRTNLQSSKDTGTTEAIGHPDLCISRDSHQIRESLNARTEIEDIRPQNTPSPVLSAQHFQVHLDDGPEQISTDLWTIGLGPDTADIARDLFSALREFDRKGVDIICVESINDDEGDAAAAVMNRLRKAAEAEITL
ncbi:hypothetical protein IMSHALPRED_007873 [Imshaugia aleurites]|uniref:Threonylcarbamoyl-AMP synthase n=1 Tax=Imshaugia aleurites TaxID=172621 RepID=A0A8H3FRI1_9LECA|nr:hypothetical protein IMSHALPRED_007873 [Imshaugia aleurites]